MAHAIKEKIKHLLHKDGSGDKETTPDASPGYADVNNLPGTTTNVPEAYFPGSRSVAPGETRLVKPYSSALGQYPVAVPQGNDGTPQTPASVPEDSEKMMGTLLAATEQPSEEPLEPVATPKVEELKELPLAGAEPQDIPYSETDVRATDPITETGNVGEESAPLAQDSAEVPTEEGSAPTTEGLAEDQPEVTDAETDAVSESETKDYPGTEAEETGEEPTLQTQENTEPEEEPGMESKRATEEDGT